MVNREQIQNTLTAQLYPSCMNKPDITRILLALSVILTVEVRCGNLPGGVRVIKAVSWPGQTPVHPPFFRFPFSSISTRTEPNGINPIPVTEAFQGWAVETFPNREFYLGFGSIKESLGLIILILG